MRVNPVSVRLAAVILAAAVTMTFTACGSVGRTNDNVSSLAPGDIASASEIVSASESSSGSGAASSAAASKASPKESSKSEESSKVSPKESSKSEESSKASPKESSTASPKAEERASSAAQTSSAAQSTAPAPSRTDAGLTSAEAPQSTSSSEQRAPETQQEKSEPQSEPQNEPQEQDDPPRTEPSRLERPEPADRERPLVVIDAGHQSSGNYEQEPIGPGAYETKAKVSGGTQGTTTGIPEYELTLALALRLGDMLEQRGCDVIQVRTSSDVNISNSERAAVANDANADVFIRIHANGSDNPSANGAMTICQTQWNPYNGDLYDKSRALSESVLTSLCEATGCRREYVWETDTMSGINWAAVPVTIVEVGYMSNPTEDVLLSQDDYRQKVCEGIADGIMGYLGE